MCRWCALRQAQALHLYALLYFAPGWFNSLYSISSTSRDSYYARNGLLDRLNNEGFDYRSDRLLQFPHRFLHWRAFGLGVGNRPLRGFGYLACLTASS